MHTITAQNDTAITALFIGFLVLESAMVLVSTYWRNLFGIFTTLAALSGTVGAVLLINAARDAAMHYVVYKTINGIVTYRTHGTLFWASIAPIFIEVPFVVCIVCLLLALIVFALNARHHDARQKRSKVAAKKPVTGSDQTKQATPKKAPFRKTVPATGTTDDETTPSEVPAS